VHIGNPVVDVPAVLGDIEDVIEVQPQGEGRYQVICAPNVDRRPQLAKAIVERGWDLLELRTIGMSLEDIFVELTTEEGVLPTGPVVQGKEGE
jgi:ABC-2 type transport system ATP-binding protein